jgi:hypothetical protein
MSFLFGLAILATSRHTVANPKREIGVARVKGPFTAQVDITSSGKFRGSRLVFIWGILSIAGCDRRFPYLKTCQIGV